MSELNPSPMTRLAVGLSLAGAVLSSTSACETTPATNPNEPLATVTASASSDSRPSIFDSSPNNPCAQPFVFNGVLPTAEDMRAAAKTCEPVLKAGHVALVMYNVTGLTPAAEVAIAHQVDELANHAWGVRLKTTVFQASSAAEVAAAPYLTNGCVDSESEPLAAAADTTMAKELAGQNYVIGVTEMAACSNREGGSADPIGHGAGIFLGTIPGIEKAPASRSLIARLIAHELGHKLGFGHNGSAYGINANGGFSEQFQRGILFGGTLDLQAYLQTCRYDEYGSSGVMGNRIQEDFIVPSPIEQDEIAWPKKVLDGTAGLSRTVESGGSTLHRTDIQQGNFFTVKLNEPFVFGNKPLVANEYSFGQLAIVPQAYPGEGIMSIDLYLVDSHGNTAELEKVGVIDATTSKRRTWDLTYGSQTIHMQLLPNGGMNVRTA